MLVLIDFNILGKSNNFKGSVFSIYNTKTLLKIAFIYDNLCKKTRAAFFGQTIRQIPTRDHFGIQRAILLKKLFYNKF